MNPDLPTTLLRDAEVIVVEKSVGVKASMEQFYGANEDKILPPMVEQRKRLLQMLARLHASIQERSRYQGWSKPYEYTEADAAYGMTVINSWLDDLAASSGGGDFVDETRLPWLALQETLERCVFGSKVDGQTDLILIRKLIRGMFSATSYRGEKEEEGCGEIPPLPVECLSTESFKAWLRSLPDFNPPSWVGLDEKAEERLQAAAAARLLENIYLIN